MGGLGSGSEAHWIRQAGCRVDPNTEGLNARHSGPGETRAPGPSLGYPPLPHTHTHAHTATWVQIFEVRASQPQQVQYMTSVLNPNVASVLQNEIKCSETLSSNNKLKP